ncbi:MAG: hypothetical protein O7E57_02720 [Gammaproteobacteria bacterium]|nr:hypothetical protein [Gammaproteobacteria bacterium]
MNMNVVNILRMIAIAVAVIAAFVTIPYVAIAFIVLGLGVGFMGIEAERRILYLVMAVALTTVAGTLGSIPVAGSYLTDMLTNLSSVINAGAVAVILTIIYERITS